MKTRCTAFQVVAVNYFCRALITFYIVFSFTTTAIQHNLVQLGHQITECMHVFSCFNFSFFFKFNFLAEKIANFMLMAWGAGLTQQSGGKIYHLPHRIHQHRVYFCMFINFFFRFCGIQFFFVKCPST